jgi:hypothetical protein
VRITIDVERLSKEEMHFFEQIGEGTYDDVEFKVFYTVPRHSLEIWVQDERYLISSEEMIEATLQAIIDEPSEPTLGERVDRQIRMYKSEIAEAQQDYDDCDKNGPRAEIGEWISSFRSHLEFFEEGVERALDRYSF